MLPPFEGQLGPPARFVLPVAARTRPEDHPLLRLAASSRTRLFAAGLDPVEVLKGAAERQAQTREQVWGLSRRHLPEFLVIGRIRGERLRLPPEQFVGRPGRSWRIPAAAEILAHARGTIVDREVVTVFGEVVRADLQGVIFTKFLDLERAAPSDDPSATDWWTLRRYLNPRRTIEPPGPELFTWSSVFNTPKDLCPALAGGEQIKCLTLDQQVWLANHFLGYGLEALAGESRDRHIRLAARRLIELSERGLVDLHLTRAPYQALEELDQSDRLAFKSTLPEEHGLAFLAASAAERRGSKAVLLVPLSWIDLALQREIVALAHLVRLASLARDWYFGQLSGTSVAVCRELRQSAEISLFDVAQARADGLAARLLDEAAAWDNRVYGFQLNRDTDCSEIQRKAHRFGCYEDPPEPRSRWRDDGPGRGPEDDWTGVPRPPGRPSTAA